MSHLSHPLRKVQPVPEGGPFPFALIRYGGDRQAGAARTIRFHAGWTALALVTLGVIRPSPYVHCRSLWFDEALLALNLVDRGYAHLTAPLDYHQAAPLAFLWAERAIISLSHTNEYTLPPIAVYGWSGSLAALLSSGSAICEPARRTSCTDYSVALSVPDHYSNEVKQYSSDVLISTMLILYSATMVDAPLRRRGMIALALCGSVSLWLSHPSVFVLGGIGAALFISRLLKGRTTDVIYLARLVRAWLCSFSVLYFVSLRFIAGDHAFRSFWSDGMLPSPIGFRGACRWMCDVACKSFHDPLGFTAARASVLAVIGCADVARRNVGKCGLSSCYLLCLWRLRPCSACIRSSDN